MDSESTPARPTAIEPRNAANEPNAIEPRNATNEPTAIEPRNATNEPTADEPRNATSEPNAVDRVSSRSTLSPIVLALALVMSLIVTTPAIGMVWPGRGRADLTTLSHLDRLAAGSRLRAPRASEWMAKPRSMIQCRRLGCYNPGSAED
jgi:hypothetical protein